jgi:hypothetical protein
MIFRCTRGWGRAAAEVSWPGLFRHRRSHAHALCHTAMPPLTWKILARRQTQYAALAERRQAKTAMILACACRFLLPGYLIAYRLEDEELVVIRVLHGARISEELSQVKIRLTDRDNLALPSALAVP